MGKKELHIQNTSLYYGIFSHTIGEPRETTQHVPGPIWATFGLLILKHYIAPLLFFLAAGTNCAKILSSKCAYIPFWLNPTGHFKFHNTLNTLRLLQTSVGLLVLPCTHQSPPSSPPFFFSCPGQRTSEDRYLCPWQACTTTACSECAH